MPPDPIRPDRSPGGGGQRMLAVVGGGVLVLALAGVAWALRGPGDGGARQVASGTQIAATSGPPSGFIGPKVMGPAAPTAVTPTSTTPTSSAATPDAATPATPDAATPATPDATTPATPDATTPATPATPAAPAATAAGAPVAYHFAVEPGDTMWNLTTEALRRTGRPTTPAVVATYLSRFYSHNSSTVGADPNVIHPGQDLVWPQGL